MSSSELLELYYWFFQYEDEENTSLIDWFTDKVVYKKRS